MGTKYSYHYQVVNGNGALIKTFGTDFSSAKKWAEENEGCGLRYCLRVQKYRVYHSGPRLISPPAKGALVNRGS